MFILNINNKPEINHKNCNKQKNYYKNLEWVTDSENKQHAWKNNIYKPMRGELQKTSKLTKENVLWIRKNKNNYSQRELAKMFNVSFQNISKIILKKNMESYIK